MSSKKYLFTTIIVALILIVFGSQVHTAYSQPTAVKSTPTLFLHGWGSSVHAEQQMTNSIKRAGISNSITQALVTPKGQVKLRGHIPANAHNPIIEVGFQDNRNTNFHQDGRWLKNVIVKLQRVYHIKRINLVGHSMGNMAIVYYLLDNASQKHLPKLERQVNIAGHFDGVLGEGDRPNRLKLNRQGRPDHLDHNYQTLMALRQKYPRHQVRVLNIFGDKKDGTHSDGDVSNASAQSLRYLIGSRALSYQEIKISGRNGQHSRLHENKQVDRILMHFLWNK